MSQDLFDQQDVAKVECPVCGVATWEGAPTCLSCGTTLRPAVTSASEDLWSTDDDSLFEDVAEAELVDDGLWDDVDAPVAPPSAFGTGAASTPLFAAPAPTADESEGGLWESADEPVDELQPAVPADAPLVEPGPGADRLCQLRRGHRDGREIAEGLVDEVALRLLAVEALDHRGGASPHAPWVPTDDVEPAPDQLGKAIDGDRQVGGTGIGGAAGVPGEDQ